MKRKFKKGRSPLLILPATMLLIALHTRAQQPAAAARPIHEFSLAEAIDFSAKNSVLVKNALLDYQIQVQSNRATTSQALPQITGNLGVTDYIQIPTTLIPGEFIGQPGTDIPVKFGLKWNQTGGITLQQGLFDGQVFVG